MTSYCPYWPLTGYCESLLCLYVSNVADHVSGGRTERRTPSAETMLEGCSMTDRAEQTSGVQPNDASDHWHESCTRVDIRFRGDVHVHNYAISTTEASPPLRGRRSSGLTGACRGSRSCEPPRKSCPPNTARRGPTRVRTKAVYIDCTCASTAWSEPNLNRLGHSTGGESF